jgi:L-methionine (R)-S-oxide reductase
MKAKVASKGTAYERCLKEITATVKNKTVRERMGITCQVLKKNLPHYLWAGFYFPRGDFLELGPSVGPSACAEIPFTGVCGKAAKNKTPIIVPDVDKFPGHVICDPRSRSEIALPVFNGARRVIAVFDVDNTELGSFDQTDQKWLEKILRNVFSVLA